MITNKERGMKAILAVILLLLVGCSGVVEAERPVLSVVEGMGLGKLSHAG
jgi:hypothetical protein